MIFYCQYGYISSQKWFFLRKLGSQYANTFNKWARIQGFDKRAYQIRSKVVGCSLFTTYTQTAAYADWSACTCNASKHLLGPGFALFRALFKSCGCYVDAILTRCNLQIWANTNIVHYWMPGDSIYKANNTFNSLQYSISDFVGIFSYRHHPLVGYRRREIQKTVDYRLTFLPGTSEIWKLHL